MACRGATLPVGAELSAPRSTPGFRAKPRIMSGMLRLTMHRMPGASRETAQKYAVQSMPTFIFIKNKKTVDELKGAGEDALRQMISRHI